MIHPEVAFDWSLDPKTLRNNYKQTNFSATFEKLISKNVIDILSPQLIEEPHNLIYDDGKIYRHLIEPLEKFVCDLDEGNTTDDIRQVLNHLKTLKQPSKMCRRVLKTGDVLFSCNDCGYDQTCVVCIDCFHKSAHKDHNYRMSNTEGGGCCDCGDVEAWKQHHACSDHRVDGQTSLSLADFEDKEKRAKQIQSDKQNILDKVGLLPERIATKYFLVCQAALHYARKMLSWGNPEQLPTELEWWKESKEPISDPLLDESLGSKNFFTVLCNDEVHTYDHVINTLVKVVKCTKMTASIMASTVSREGRSFVYRDNFESCSRVQTMIANVRDSGQGPLKVDVIHGMVLAHQAFALKLIEWVQKMALICDGFRVLTAYTLLGTYEPIPGQEDEELDQYTLLEKVMLSNTSYWKMARIDWNDLLVTTMLTEYSIKEQFGRLITRLYKRLVHDFIRDDHDHSVSILTMTTQLYTVPSLICMLIEEENALPIIAETLLLVCESRGRESRSLSFDMHGLKRGFYVISDFKHLINIKPTKWTPQLRASVIKSVELFLHRLDSMQGMDQIKRQLGQHIEYEPDWESGMTLQSRLSGLISRLVIYCSYDSEILVEITKEVQRKLLKDGTRFKFVRKELYGYEVNCIQYDVSTLPVSIHLPLTRFGGALILELMKLRPSDTVPYDENLVIFDEQNSGEKKRTMIEIVEHSLRAEVMIAQFRSGMWRRNGYSLVNQISYFHGPLMRREMFDRDILVLQEGAAMCDANEFMIHLLNKFQLFNWISSETARDLNSSSKAVGLHNDEEIMTQTMSLGEEFLQLLLTITGERFRPGVGHVTELDVIKNEIIQLLCINPLTRSELSHKLYMDDNELDCVKEVAILRRSGEASTGKYELRPEYYDKFNPFFYHYSRRNQSNALDAQLKRKKITEGALVCCPPPAPVELTEQFANLNELLKCDITLILIQRVLRRALRPPENDLECSSRAPIQFTASDLQLDQCLHLIGLGLYEQERNPTTFRYLQAAHDKDIFPLLKQCYEQAKRSKDLIFWLMKKTQNLTILLDEKYSDGLDEAAIKINSFLRECFKPILSACDSNQQESRKRNSELSKQRHERIMAMMKARQEKFLANPTTKQLVEDTEKNESPTNRNAAATTSAKQSPPVYTSRSGRKVRPPKFAMESEDVETPMDCESEDDKMDTSTPGVSHLCILCKDEQRIGFDQPTMVLLAFVQRSGALSKNRSERRIPNYALTPSNQLKHQYLMRNSKQQSCRSPDIYSYTSDNSWSFDATFMPSDLFFGPHTSTCGHVMHFECWKGFYDAVLKRENSRPNRQNRHVSFDLEKHEILCPLCECISNAIIPLLPDYTNFARRQDSTTVFAVPRQTIDNSPEKLSTYLHALRGTVDMFKHVRHLKGVVSSVHVSQEDKYMRLLQPKPINDVLEELDETANLSLRDFINSARGNKIQSNACTESLLRCISTLSERIHSVGLDLDRSVSDINHARIFMMNSWSVSFTIQAFERSQRFKGSPLLDDLDSAKNSCLSYLIRSTCSSMLTYQSDMLQSLLVKKLRYLLISEEHHSSSPCCLDIDVFETFVSLYILMQKLYAHEGDPDQSQSNDQTAWTTCAYDHEYYRNLLHLMLVLNMLQVCITLQNDLSLNCQATSAGASLAATTDAAGHKDVHDLGDSYSSAHSDSSATSGKSAMSAGQADAVKMTGKDCSALNSFYRDIILASGHPNDRMPVVDEKFCSRVRRNLLPFLRSCSIFFYHLSHIQPPEQLRKKSAFHEGHDFIQQQQQLHLQRQRRNDSSPSISGEEFVDAQANFCSSPSSSNTNMSGGDMTEELAASDAEFAAICNYLNLPDNFTTLLKSKEACHLARSWLRHSRVLILIKSALNEQRQQQQQPGSVLAATASQSSQSATNTGGSSSSLSMTELMPVKFIRQPHRVNRLIDLPHDYSKLVDQVSTFTCPSIKNEDSRTPTMCLVCGVMLCSQSYCCQRDLNNLASNYRQILQRQQEARQLAILTAAASVFRPDGSGANSGASSNHNYASGGGNGGGTGATGALSLMSSTAAMLVSSVVANQQNASGVHSTVGAPPAHSSSTSSQTAAAAAAAAAAASATATSASIHQQLVGSCTYHAHECSGGVGIFLRVRNCQILLLCGLSKGCYMPAPYVDDHGETDFGLTRGNPLQLNRRYYEKLQNMWLSHSITEQVSRTLEYSPYMASINWHLH